MTTKTLTITTKKNTEQELTFSIRQERPYPTLASYGSALRWQGDDGQLFGQYGNGPKGIGNGYRCNLLRSDLEDVKGSRLDFAGYEGNPGAIVLRGQDLGEMQITFDKLNPHLNGPYAEIKIRGHYEPTPGESSFIKAQIVPALLEAIEEHKAELKAEAVQDIKARFAHRISEARAQLDKLEQEAAEAVANL